MAHKVPRPVHASKKFDAEGYLWVRKHFPEIAMPLPDAFEHGGIVGIVTLTACYAPGTPMIASPWYTGQYAFSLADARPLPFRAARGKLGFFAVPAA